MKIKILLGITLKLTFYIILLDILVLSYVSNIYAEPQDKSGQVYENNKYEAQENSELPRTTAIDIDETDNEKEQAIEETLNKIEIELAIEYQMITGEQVFTVINSGGQRISKLTYPIKGNMLTLKGELRFNPRLSVGGKYGSSDFDKTTNSDEDWNFTGMHNGSLKQIDYQITKQNCKSKMEMFDINAYYRLFNLDDSDAKEETSELFVIDKFFLDIFGGYQQQRGRYTMKDPTTEYLRFVDSSWWEATGLPLNEGLNSPYKVIYRGPKLGLRIGSSNKKISTRISMSYGWIKTRAHGYWNLRDYSFSQNSTNTGYALNLDLDVRYKLTKNWFIGGGYTYTEYRQHELKESGVQPGDTYDNLDIIRDANNKVYGPYLMVGSIW